MSPIVILHDSHLGAQGWVGGAAGGMDRGAVQPACLGRQLWDWAPASDMFVLTAGIIRNPLASGTTVNQATEYGVSFAQDWVCWGSRSLL